MGADRRALALFCIAVSAGRVEAQRVLHRSDAFEVTDREVRQGTFRAVVVSPDTIRSSYPRAAREVHFKFALNGADNEFPPGIEHVVNLRPQGGTVTTPLYVFGREPEAGLPQPAATQGEEGPAKLLIRLDLRHVTESLRVVGAYRAPRGGTVTRLDRVTIIGDTEPLRWDIGGIAPGGALDLRDPDGDGIWETTLTFAPDYTRPLAATGDAQWARTRDIARYPALSSPEPIVDATHRLSLEELTQLVRDDGALAAGAKWPGVWTRDVSFAALLSLAIVAPDAVKRSLLAKVDSLGRIIQDTGTGGSWPVSTDRLCWLLAAWELYQVTGDRAWLRQAYDTGRRSIAADRHAAVDRETGLIRGESSFLDWREQSYPRWMEPADIYESQALGTNAVHHGAYRAMARMARALGGADAREATRWTAYADTLRVAIERHFWQADRGWYGQFRYGRAAKSLSPRAEALGLALVSLTGVSSPARAAASVGTAPQVPFGTPTFWPYIAGIRFYHNGSIWPFVTAFSTWAAADAGNTAVVEHGLATLLRGTALFLTNKENMVAETGHFEGTALNSDRQLWSVAGSLALSYRILFGIRLDGDRLRFRPMVPPAYAGERTLRGLRWRGATLGVTVRGHGSGVRRALLDGKPLSQGAVLDASLSGAHQLVLELDGRWPEAPIAMVAHTTTPPPPDATVVGFPPAAGLLAPVFRLRAATEATGYVVARDGVRYATTADSVFTTPATGRSQSSDWQFATLHGSGFASHLGAPHSERRGDVWYSDQHRAHCAASREAACLEWGVPPRHRQGDPPLEFRVEVPRTGRYRLVFGYRNGNGPVNTEDKVAVRTIVVDGRARDVIVFPQRGSGSWDAGGKSSATVVRLARGRHRVSLAFTPLDRNMNGSVNEMIVTWLQVEHLDPPQPKDTP